MDSMEDALEDAQNDKAQLPGIGRDGITSGVQSSRWMQTLGRGESSQRAPQSCNENVVIHVTSGVIHGIRPVGVFRCQVM